MALLCVWHRAVLPSKGAKGDTLEVILVLKLLQWQCVFNQTAHLGSIDITLCYLGFSSLLVFCSLGICRNPFRLCVLLSICCSLFFLTGACMASDISKCLVSFPVLLLGIFKCIKLPGWNMQYCIACRFK